MPQALFCHDMAFYLQMPEITPRNEIGVFMRTDSERPTGTPLPRGNLDLSLKGRSETPINRFVAEIARHKVVFTNRLHIGICAAMLGREVHLSGNDYFKIRAIYEASIKPSFSNVMFSTDTNVPEPTGRSVWSRLWSSFGS